jgi:ArsR family transcriptional regulator
MYEKLFQLQEEVFKVLANQKRLEIIQLLANGELCVGEMIDMLGLPQANLSQHLAQMRRAGLLARSKKGTKVYYRVADPAVAEAVFVVRDFLIHSGKLDEEATQYLAQSAKVYPVTKDVVCGMRLSAARSSYRADHEGQMYFFCAAGCQEKFLERPEIYAHTKHVMKGALS